MDRWTWLLLGAIAGGVLGACRCLGGKRTHQDAPAKATPLGYDQHNVGYENHSPVQVGAGLGYFGIYPSGA